MKSKVMETLKDYLKSFKETTRDPVKHCLVFKSVGCAHVDGFLCNMQTCKDTVVLEITPNGTRKVEQVVEQGVEQNLSRLVSQEIIP